MQLVCAADDRYAMPMAITLYSALSNFSGGRIAVHILNGGMTAKSRQRIQKVLAPFDASICWHQPQDDLSNLPVSGHVSPSTYLRLIIPELLPSTIGKAIYLDCDVLVDADLAELWRADLGDRYFLAFKERPMSAAPLSKCPALSFSPDAGYFNAGVLMMNLDRMRADRISERAISFVRQWPAYARFADQDALNAVAIGRWSEIDRRWNTFVKGDFRYRRGVILHFKGPRKPWREPRYFQGHQKRPALKAYDQFMRRSGWFTTAEWIKFLMVRMTRHTLRAVLLPIIRPFRRIQPPAMSVQGTR